MGETSKRDGADADGLLRADLEARMVVLEIVSMTALALALDTSENGSPEQARGIAELIQDTVRQRCREVGLSDKDQKSANAYADELLSTALVSLYPD
ncbi:hypothetical protein SAMN03159496_00885 [Rhizobium sp. NFR07]|uniref:hypothetical protein n=1 Tax=Rhizobium sp. NFR07 TaxID=1566262 RepID=UPI0008E01AE6|nr:hypothetical protein [Rhizobium sp. NFR07]SFA91452.1 hypothetical protein SAMN03159496_00885 [Rhizobium sp. NFR07]